MLTAIHWVLFAGVLFSLPQEPPEIPFPPWHDALPQAAKEILASADRFEVFAIEPAKKTDHKGPAAKQEEWLHGHKILAKTSVIDKEMRKKLLAAIEKGVADCGALEQAQCFIPHHGLRATAGKKMAELVICFRCRRIAVSVDQKLVKTVGTKDAPRALLDRVLKNAGPSLPPRTKERK